MRGAIEKSSRDDYEWRPTRCGTTAGAGGRRRSGKQKGSCSSAACRRRWGGETDGLNFFYAGREHAAIALMREKYTATYPASNGEGDRAAVYSGADSLRLRPRLAGRPVNVTSLEHERWEAGAPRVLSPDGDQLGFRSYTQGWLLLQSPPTH